VEQNAGGLTFTGNIFAASKTSCLYFGNYLPGQTLAASNYNGFARMAPGVNAVALGTTGYATLAAWQACGAPCSGGASGYDPASLEATWGGEPIFASSTDFHLMSAAGRFLADGSLTSDGATSRFVDAADPASPVGAEVRPNGGRRNLGAF